MIGYLKKSDLYGERNKQAETVTGKAVVIIYIGRVASGHFVL